MRVALIYPAARMRTPVDPWVFFDSPRGLSGSEVACWEYARGLSRLGHDVTWFTGTTATAHVDGVQVMPDTEWPTRAREGWGAVVCFMSPGPLSHAPASSLRVLLQQCTDHGATEPGWERHVDLLLGLSRWHVDYLIPQASLPASAYGVCHNGVDTSEFVPLEKVPGRCVWASSHDRGLHRLLEAWPAIRREVPHATLRVLYDTAGMQAFAKAPDGGGPLMAELKRRSQYCIHALSLLRNHGVTVLGSVSRRQMAQEFGRAHALLYPCDPVRPTESFGSTVLEAMSAGCHVGLSMADAFRELWAPAATELRDIIDDGRRILSGSAAPDMVAREHAQKFAWPRLVVELDAMLRAEKRRTQVSPVAGEAVT